MNAINDFLESELGLTIVVAFLIIIIGIFVYSIIKKQREARGYYKTRNENQIELPKMQNYEEDNEQSIRIIKEENIDFSLPKVPTQESINNELNNVVTQQEEIKEEVNNEVVVEPKIEEVIPITKVEKKEVIEGELPLVDIPIPDVEDSPFDVDATVLEVTEEDDESNEKSIVVEETPEVIEENVSTDEIVNIEETLEVPEKSQEALAFGGEATVDNKIEESVIIEEPHEYTGEKTELFEFPDFNGLGTDSNNITFDKLHNGEKIEKEILEAATSFIDKIMTK